MNALAPARKAYVIPHRSAYLCITCKTTIKSKRDAMKHECASTSGRGNADRTAGGSEL